MVFNLDFSDNDSKMFTNYLDFFVNEDAGSCKPKSCRLSAKVNKNVFTLGTADDNYPVTVIGGKFPDNVFVQMVCKFNGVSIKSAKMFLNRSKAKSSSCGNYITANPMTPILINYSKRDLYTQVLKSFNDYFTVI